VRQVPFGLSLQEASCVRFHATMTMLATGRDSSVTVKFREYQLLGTACSIIAAAYRKGPSSARPTASHVSFSTSSTRGNPITITAMQIAVTR